MKKEKKESQDIFFSLMIRFNYIYFSPNSPKKTPDLTAVLLNVSNVLAKESHGHDTRNVALWSIDMHIQLQLLSNSLDVLQSLLVVGTSTTDPDLNLVLNEHGRKFTESANNTLESRCDVL